MMTSTELQFLSRRWTHSFEEDSPTELVYRPSDFPFNRSRGRNQFDLRSSGEVVDISSGRDDVPEATIGLWKVDNNQLVIKFKDGSQVVYPVKEVKSDKLVIKKG